MRLKPFFTYYGGKYRIAPRYPRPEYSRIIEPFCGSAGYALTHNRKTVLLYDLNERIVGTWKYLIKVSEKEILSLPEVFDDVRHLKIAQAYERRPSTAWNEVLSHFGHDKPFG